MRPGHDLSSSTPKVPKIIVFDAFQKHGDIDSYVKVTGWWAVDDRLIFSTLAALLPGC